VLGVTLLLPASGLRAQAWNDPRVLALVQQATMRRAQQLADTGLMDYRAVAHGYLTFLAQVGEGFPEPPRIIKTDELALEVYWRSPGLSKQLIVGRRDTTLLPTDILYHRDHLGIVQNNFANIIRLGEGDEVRDVPHPLSAMGVGMYDFAITDSLRLTIPGRTIDVYEVKVRPKNDRAPRVIGAVYIDRDGGQVVRMALSFTRASFIDESLEDLSIVLENGLFGTRFWLPRRQEIEIRRGGTWLDYPVRTIIRGRWEISGYQLNLGLPVQAFGPIEFVQAPPQVLQQYPWKGRILDSLPADILSVQDADVRRIQDETRLLVREEALQRVQGTRLSAQGLSDFASVNRVQGLTVGGGLSQRLGSGFAVGGRARYGIDDRLVRGEVDAGWQDAGGLSVRAFGRHDLTDARDVPERSGVLNSIAAQEFGSDATEPYDVRAIGAELTAPMAGLRWRLSADVERQSAVRVHATPVEGTYAPTIAALDYTPLRLHLGIDRPKAAFGLGIEGRAAGALEWLHTIDRPACAAACLAGPSEVIRGSLDADLERRFGSYRAISRTIAAAAIAPGATVPVQALVFFGGPVTAPGYDLHQIAGTSGISQRVELQLPVPFVAIPLGRFSESPARATLAPFVSLVSVDPSSGLTCTPACAPPAGDTPGRTARFFPAAGVGLLSIFDLLRLDVARGFRNGGRWTFSVDVARDLWGIL
jgi:hypothetical protein